MEDRRGRTSHEGRNVPGAIEYRENQIRQDRVREGDIGGMYTIIELTPLVETGQRILPISKTWHGAPTASLRRAFHALGHPGIVTACPPNVITQLRILQDLYFGPFHSNQSLNNPGPSQQGDTGSKRPSDDNEDDSHRDKKHRVISPQKKGKEKMPTTTTYNLRTRYPEVPGKVWCPEFKLWVNPYWEFGPQSTAQDKIRKACRLNNSKEVL